MEEAKDAPTKFVAVASQWFLLVVTWYGKGAVWRLAWDDCRGRH